MTIDVHEIARWLAWGIVGLCVAALALVVIATIASDWKFYLGVGIIVGIFVLAAT
jgi:hypothetical protein